MSGPGSSVTERDPMVSKSIKHSPLIDRGRRGDE